MTLISKNDQALKNIDWRKDYDRKRFEKYLQNHRNVKKDWGWCRKFSWFIGIIIVLFLTASAFYGGIAYVIVQKARNQNITEKLPT